MNSMRKMEGPRLHYTYQLGARGRVCLLSAYIALGGVWVMTMGHLLIPDFETNIRQTSQNLMHSTAATARALQEGAQEADWQARMEKASKLADDVVKGPQKRALQPASPTTPPAEE